jgi:hypothetical protein
MSTTRVSPWLQWLMRAVMLVVLVGAACGSPSSSTAPREPAPTASRSTDVDERWRQVTRQCDELLKVEELQPLAAKLPIDLAAGSITPAMLALADTPTTDERQVVVALVARHSACHRKETEVLGSLSGPPSQWYTNQRAKHLELLVGLYDGLLTYGQFNTALQAAMNDADRERAAEELARIRVPADQAASIADERARRAEEVQRSYDAFVAAHPPPP